jgi:hypothetical protein
MDIELGGLDRYGEDESGSPLCAEIPVTLEDDVVRMHEEPFPFGNTKSSSRQNLPLKSSVSVPVRVEMSSDGTPQCISSPYTNAEAYSA